MSTLDDLTAIIARGWQGNTNELAACTEKAINGLFGERYRAAAAVYEAAEENHWRPLKPPSP